MFDIIAVTGATANWLLAQAGRRSAISNALEEIASTNSLATSVVSMGSLRIAGSRRASVVALWNNDLLSGEGYERWGFCRLSGDVGLFAHPEIKDEVFERFLTVSDLRLKGLRLDDRLIHRNVGDDLHTCLSGRGEKAWHYSLGFSDKTVVVPGGKIPAVMTIGPFTGKIGSMPVEMQAERKKLPVLIEEVTRITATLYKRPALDSSLLLELRESFQPETQLIIEFGHGLQQVPILREHAVPTESLSYDQWAVPDSPLSPEQRAILDSDVILKSPLRIIGPGGSGKTLLMQLIAIRRLRAFESAGEPCRIIYIVHNASMMQTVRERFTELGCDNHHSTSKKTQLLEVLTLSEYSTRALQPEVVPVIDPDAYETKQFQRYLVTLGLKAAIDNGLVNEAEHSLLHQVSLSDEGISLFAELLVNEFGVAIKAHDLVFNKQGYVFAERSLSRLHAALNPAERSIIFDIFTEYQRTLTQELAMLDSDDLAITVLGKVTTPLWRLKRKHDGFDFIFVDEAQLFNENERRLFPLLTKENKTHVPIVLALDEAQAVNGSVGAGFGALGFGELSNESLNKVFRSTPAILKLAFHIIQKSTDLFGPDFPDFTDASVSLIPDDHHSARNPVLLTGGQARSPGTFVAKIVKALRRENLRQICVVVFGERYWTEVVAVLRKEGVPLLELVKRGEKISVKSPLVIVSKPEFIGGQEFDAVVCVGLEEGAVPPTSGGNQALTASFEQRALREMYVAFTRARYRLVIANTVGSNVSPLLRDAIGVCLSDEKVADWLK